MNFKKSPPIVVEKFKKNETKIIFKNKNLTQIKS